MKLVTATGRTIDPANPKPEDICLFDIAHGLAREERFDGNTFVPYSVAQHSCHVADLMAARIPQLEDRPKALRWVQAGLLHDASEAYLGDLVTPLKRILPDYTALEAAWMKVIFEKYGLTENLLHIDVLKEADDTIFTCEAVCLTSNPENYGVTKLEAEATLDDVHSIYPGIDGLLIPNILERGPAAQHFLDLARCLDLFNYEH